MRLFNQGVQVAVDVYDQATAGVLDAGDYITFYAQNIDDAYFKYSEDNIYWFNRCDITYRLTGVKNIFVSTLRVNIKNPYRRNLSFNAQ